MEFRQIERAVDAFQQPVTAEQVWAMCRRAFGSDVRVVSAVELGNGMYNSTYRVDLGVDRPVILRVAPEPDRQFSSERELMRNEYASVPYLAPIAPLMPRIISADFTGDVIGRDYLFQSLLDGVPAPERLGDYPRSTWPGFFGQMGAITRDVHAVRGPRFGPVVGPEFDTWSDAVIGSLNAIAADLESVGLGAADVGKVAAAAARHQAVLDEIDQPQMLSGDLWTVNVMLADGAPEPTITGVLDFDRTWWGFPVKSACRDLRVARRRPQTMRKGAVLGFQWGRPTRSSGRCASWRGEGRIVGFFPVYRIPVKARAVRPRPTMTTSADVAMGPIRKSRLQKAECVVASIRSRSLIRTRPATVRVAAMPRP